MKVVVLHDEVPAGARPDELDGLVQVREVSQALEEGEHAPLPLAVGADLHRTERELRALRPDRVFNLVEACGAQRTVCLVPALLQRLGLAHTGLGAQAMALTSHKPGAKRRLRDHGLPTPDWFEPGPGIRHAPPGTYIVKSAWEDASLGIDDSSVVEIESPDALEAATRAGAARLGGEVFAEAWVPGREWNASLLAKGADVEVLPLAEIRFDGYPDAKPRLVGYAAKWEPASFEYQHTPRCFDLSDADRSLAATLAELARRCWVVFGLSGYARVDFRVDPQGRPWILEINANPCLSSDAGFAAAAARAGLPFREVVARILEAVAPRAR